jgi:UDP-2,3-diacylglucosamine pyrophosphatase LpxH
MTHNNNNKNRYRTIVISDTHLGSKGCNAHLLNDFLKHNTSEILLLNGDIIDAWKIQQNKWHWNKKQTSVLQKLLTASKSNVKIIYITGNHDDFLRNFIPHNINFDKVKICDEYEHVGLNGKRYLVVHGDLFDTVTRLHRWVSFLGDSAYSLLLCMNGFVSFFRRMFGYQYWSLSHYLKKRVKKAVDFIYKFEDTLSSYAKSKNYDGVICGHIHVAEIRQLNGLEYMNSGDWVESCTALVETLEGVWKIIRWQEAIK